MDKAEEKLKFKVACEDWEFEQVNLLNYRTFVEEIPQHEENMDKSLRDKFHQENTYIICTRGKKLLGMMAVRDKRPFSLDNKLENLDSYLPEHRFACEFRLLSIEKEERNLRIIQGLMVMLAKLADEKGYDIALISANVKRLRFYRQIGFKEFGPVVGADEARYQPMYLTLKSSLEFRQKSKILTRLPSNFSLEYDQVVNLLPGPVSVENQIEHAMQKPSISHRSEEFRSDFQLVKSKLCSLTASKSVEIMMGSGSLANDVIAAQLSQDITPGLVMSNGEFGERLIDHAYRAGLTFQTVKANWGEVFDYEHLQHLLFVDKKIKWLWAVHSETSTGVLNDQNSLEQICSANNIKLCLDCISSIGIVPLDLSRTYLASGVSGKGLASFSGLSFVFYNHKIAPSNSIPRYLDLGLYARSEGIPFTMSSKLVSALDASLDKAEIAVRYVELIHLSKWIRNNLNGLGLRIVAKEDYASPGIITISFPESVSSGYIGRKLKENGFLLHWSSQYLIERNWIQLALMGRYSKDQIRPLFQLISDLLKPLSQAL